MEDATCDQCIELSEALIWEFVKMHLAQVRALAENMSDGEFKFGMELALDELDIRLSPEGCNQMIDNAIASTEICKQCHTHSSGDNENE